MRVGSSRFAARAFFLAAKGVAAQHQQNRHSALKSAAHTPDRFPSVSKNRAPIGGCEPALQVCIRGGIHPENPAWRDGRVFKLWHSRSLAALQSAICPMTPQAVRCGGSPGLASSAGCSTIAGTCRKSPMGGVDKRVVAKIPFLLRGWRRGSVQSHKSPRLQALSRQAAHTFCSSKFGETSYQVVEQRCAVKNRLAKFTLPGRAARQRMRQLLPTPQLHPANRPNELFHRPLLLTSAASRRGCCRAVWRRPGMEAGMDVLGTLRCLYLRRDFPLHCSPSETPAKPPRRA